MTGSTAGRTTVARGVLALLGAAAAVGVGALTGATGALGDIGTTASGDGLTLTMSTPGPVLAGVAASYTIGVANTGTAALANVFVQFQLPSGMTLRALPANCVRSRFGGNAGPAACTFGTLAPGALASATVSIVSATPGAFAVDAAAIGQIPLGGSGFQVVATPAELAVPVAPGPTDVQVTGSSNNGSPPVGSPFTYTFQVKDNGPQGAAGVTFDDALPGTIALSSVTTSLGACTAGPTPGSIHCALGDLAVGQQATIAITAIPTATGPVTDVASIAAAGPDTQPANDTVGVTVQPR
jgi:uncharacterized repeat protein (TIGR01451 family)